MIKQFKQLLTNKDVNPITVTEAVYDKKAGRMDKVLEKMVTLSDDTEPTDDINEKDADLLDGMTVDQLVDHIRKTNLIVNNLPVFTTTTVLDPDITEGSYVINSGEIIDMPDGVDFMNGIVTYTKGYDDNGDVELVDVIYRAFADNNEYTARYFNGAWTDWTNGASGEKLYLLKTNNKESMVGAVNELYDKSKDTVPMVAVVGMTSLWELWMEIDKAMTSMTDVACGCYVNAKFSNPLIILNESVYEIIGWVTAKNLLKDTVTNPSLDIDGTFMVKSDVMNSMLIGTVTGHDESSFNVEWTSVADGSTVEQINATISNTSETLGDKYNEAIEYTKGQLTIFENKLYRCIDPTTGTFDISKWEETTIMEVAEGVDITEEEFLAIPEEERNTNGIKYNIIDKSDISAENMDYDDTKTGYNVTNVQQAIEAQNTLIENNASSVLNISGYKDYDSTKSYVAGDYCVHTSKLWECLEDTTGGWDETKWKLASISSQVAEINDNLINLKKSVSDGKSSLASAITAKGVMTAADATFETMVENLLSIETVENMDFSIKYYNSNTSTSGGSVVTNSKTCQLSSYQNVIGSCAGNAWSDSDRYVQITSVDGTVKTFSLKYSTTGDVSFTMNDASGVVYNVSGNINSGNGNFSFNHLPPDCTVYCYAKSSGGSSTKAATTSLVVI